MSALPGTTTARPSALRRLLHLGRWAAGATALAALALLLGRAPLGWGALAVVGGIGAVGLLLQPALGLYALAFAVPFGSLRELHLGGVSVGASELLAGATLAAWLARMAARRRVHVVRTRLTLALAVYLGALCVAVLPATALTPAIKELAKWAELLAIYTVAASAPTEGQARGVVAALLVAGSLEAALGIYQFLFQVGPAGFVLMGRYMRAHGTFLQPNPFGGYLGLLLPLGYGLVVAEWPRAREAWRGGAPGRAWLWHLALGAAAIISAGLVASWSRGALVGVAGGAALVALALGRGAWPLAAAAAALLAVGGPELLALLPGDLLARLTETVDYLGVPDLMAVEVTDANFAVVERVAHWIAAWRMFSRSPWIGVGTGQYAVVYPGVAVPRWQDPLGHAHNYYLNVLAEGGLVALGAYLVVLWTAVASAWRAAARESGWRRGVALGALGMLGHLIAHSAFDNLYVHEMYLVVGIVLGLVAWRPAGADADGRAEPSGAPT